MYESGNCPQVCFTAGMSSGVWRQEGTGVLFPNTDLHVISHRLVNTLLASLPRPDHVCVV